MQAVLVNRRPYNMYYDYMLWVPKSHPQVDQLKRWGTLLVPAKTSSGFTTFFLWKEYPNHLLVPRHIRVDGKESAIKLIPKFPTINIESKVHLDYLGTTHQREAVEAWMQAGHGMLNLACGKGKTVIALHAISLMKTPTLVILHTKDLIKQWSQQVRKFLPGTKVGLIQGSPTRWAWRGSDVTLASLKTLTLYQDLIPIDMKAYFGAIIWDEVHHLGADTFSQTADLFLGRRYGLSATVFRGDGKDRIYTSHLGATFYSDLSQSLAPRFYIITSPVSIDYVEANAQIFDRSGQLSIPKLRTFLTSLPQRLNWEIELYRALRRMNRTVLVLSHSVDHLRKLNEMLEESGLCIGSMSAEMRFHGLHDHDIVFATIQIGKEGLDREDFDTLVISTPFGAGIDGSNTFQQAIGRVLRPLSGKQPAVIVLDDIKVRPFHKMVRGIIRMIRTWPKSKGGPYQYEYVTINDLKL